MSLNIVMLKIKIEFILKDIFSYIFYSLSVNILQIYNAVIIDGGETKEG